MSGDNGKEIPKFKTSDLYLASALKTTGLKLLSIEFNGRKGIFVFEDTKERPQLVIDFFAGKLAGSLKEFTNHWSDLKAAVATTETYNGYSYRR